jgi:hypothetical protein
VNVAKYAERIKALFKNPKTKYPDTPNMSVANWVIISASSACSAVGWAFTF